MARRRCALLALLLVPASLQLGLFFRARQTPSATSRSTSSHTVAKEPRRPDTPPLSPTIANQPRHPDPAPTIPSNATADGSSVAAELRRALPHLCARLQRTVDWWGGEMGGAYRGDVGVELALVLPYVNFLRMCGHRRLSFSISCGLMKEFYFFSPQHRELPFCARFPDERMGRGCVSYTCAWSAVAVLHNDERLQSMSCGNYPKLVNV